MDAGLAVNGKAVEIWNMSKHCALNQSQKRCFTILFLYSHFYYVVLFNCPFYGIWETQKANFVYMHLL